MSARQGVYERVNLPADPGPSPNSYQARITVEVRAFWPPNLGHEAEVVTAIVEAAKAAIDDVLGASAPLARPVKGPGAVA